MRNFFRRLEIWEWRFEKEHPFWHGVLSLLTKALTAIALFALAGLLFVIMVKLTN